MRVQTSIETQLMNYLRHCPKFEFRIMDVRHPNGWSIIAYKKNATWFERWFTMIYHHAFMIPPYKIATGSYELAVELEKYLEGTEFSVTLCR